MARTTTGRTMTLLVGLLALGALAPTVGCGMLGMEMMGHGTVRMQGERCGQRAWEHRARGKERVPHLHTAGDRRTLFGWA